MRCRSSRGGWWVNLHSSELRDGLELADNPSVGTRSHEHDVAYDCVLTMNSPATIQNLKIVIGGVVQLNDVAFRSIKDGFHFVILIEVAGGQTVAPLAGHSVI